MKYLTLLSFIAVVAFGSCKKDAPVVLTKKQILIGASKGWVVSKILSTFNGVTTDATASFPPCDLDNISVYKVDGSYSLDEGALKCDPADPQTTTGTYRFNADETELTIVDGTDSVTVKVLELTSTKFVESITISVGGVSATTTTTFVPR